MATSGDLCMLISHGLLSPYVSLSESPSLPPHPSWILSVLITVNIAEKLQMMFFGGKFLLHQPERAFQNLSSTASWENGVIVKELCSVTSLPHN